MAKILLLGGAFDPIHVGHESLARLALSKLTKKQGFDQLWFLPCYSDAFGKKDMQHWKHRVAMIEHTITYRSDTRFSVCMHEIEMANKAGTYAVVKSLMREYPGHEFAYVIGSDQASSIRDWRNSRKLIKTIPFVVVNRRYALGGYWGRNRWFKKFPHSYISAMPTEVPISSTGIVSDIVNNSPDWRSGNYPRLNHIVRKYISDHELYKHKGDQVDE